MLPTVNEVISGIPPDDLAELADAAYHQASDTNFAADWASAATWAAYAACAYRNAGAPDEAADFADFAEFAGDCADRASTGIPDEYSESVGYTVTEAIGAARAAASVAARRKYAET